MPVGLNLSQILGKASKTIGKAGGSAASSTGAGFTGGGLTSTAADLTKVKAATPQYTDVASSGGLQLQTGSLLPVVQKALQEALYNKNTTNVLALADMLCSARAAGGLITLPANYAKTPYVGPKPQRVMALEKLITSSVNAGNVPLAVKYIHDLCRTKIVLGMVPTLFSNGVFKPPRQAPAAPAPSSEQQTYSFPGTSITDTITDTGTGIHTTIAADLSEQKPNMFFKDTLQPTTPTTPVTPVKPVIPGIAPPTPVIPPVKKPMTTGTKAVIGGAAILAAYLLSRAI